MTSPTATRSSSTTRPDKDHHVPATTPPCSPTRRRAAALAVLVMAAVTGGGVAPSHAAATVSVRLGHFSPDTAEMDVYLTPFEGEEQKVLDGLAYGEVAEYVELEPGVYSAALRDAGAPADAPVRLSATVELVDGKAYTVAALGRADELRAQLLEDDLTPPPGGQARVRLINAAATLSPANVVAVDGPVLADEIEFAASTSYGAVPAGEWVVEVRDGPDGGVSTTARLDLTAGSVNSLVLLDGGSDQVRLETVVDAAGVDVSAAPPAGAPAAGGDAPAPAPGAPAAPAPGAPAAGAPMPGGAAQPVGGIDTGLGGLATGGNEAGSVTAEPATAMATLLALVGAATVVQRRRRVADRVSI